MWQLQNRRVRSKLWLLLLLSLVLALAVVGCRGSGANPSGSATITVIEPTPRPLEDTCMNNNYPENAPQFDSVSPDGGTLLESGLRIIDVKVGNGVEATSKTQTATVHYSGWLDNGCLFDSSHSRRAPAQFALNRLIPGFSDGVIGMKTGGQRRIIIPPELGYGPNGAPPTIPPNARLHFEVTLLNVESQ